MSDAEVDAKWAAIQAQYSDVPWDDSQCVDVKVGTKVMITRNLDVASKVVNGATGVVVRARRQPPPPGCTTLRGQAGLWGSVNGNHTSTSGGGGWAMMLVGRVLLHLVSTVVRETLAPLPRPEQLCWRKVEQRLETHYTTHL